MVGSDGLGGLFHLPIRTAFPSYIYLIFFLIFHCTKCEDYPMNTVTFVGKDTVFGCAHESKAPFRWYRYITSDPNTDRVIFMGSKMADHADRRFQVIRTPNQYPYQRLDLLITDIQVNLSGTYRCSELNGASRCAELIIIDSEPFCQIRNMSEETETDDTVQLSCAINVTINAEPEMLCLLNNGDVTQASCSNRSDANELSEITCAADVPAKLRTEYTCIVRLNQKPVAHYTKCTHATSKPEYTYVWRSSSAVSNVSFETTARSVPLKDFHGSGNFGCSSNIQLILLIGIPLGGVLIIILITIVLFVACRRKQSKDVQYQTKARQFDSGAPSPDYTALTVSPYEEIPVGQYSSAIPEFISSPYGSRT